MSIKVAASRFMLSSLRAGFYQQIVKSISGFEELGQMLIREAEIAQAYRQVSRADEIGSILSNLPIKEYQLIGQYYKALCVQHIGGNARGIFERVVEESNTYRAKALMSLALSEARRGNYDEEHKYFAQALKTTNSPSLIVEASRCIAVVKAKEGFHQHSLKDLEKISPLLRYTNFHVRYQYYNSCSVELCEVGRLEEARNISNIVLASPYANAYPEWRETSDDIERKGYRQSRSFVPIIQGLQHNIIRLPERENISVSQSEPARILHYDWKNRMVKEPNGDQTDDSSLDEMTNKDLIIEIVQRTSNKNMSENKLRKILEYVMEVESEPED
jgi:tetratricopeptide (TPR) repeat protein